MPQAGGLGTGQRRSWRQGRRIVEDLRQVASEQGRHRNEDFRQLAWGQGRQAEYLW